MKPKVIVTRKWPEPVEWELQKLFDVTLNEEDRPLTQEQLQHALISADAVCPTVTDNISAEVLNIGLVRTRILGNYGVGYNHIDVGAATARGIVVTNTPDVLTDCTADIALTLMLSVARRTGEGDRLIRRKGWKGWSTDFMVGTRVSDKTLGVVGMGRIGRATARRAHLGFGMNIIYYHPHQLADEFIRSIGARQCDSLDELLREADFVSLHCPGGGLNYHLIDDEKLALMKPTAFLINTARGDVIDEQALIRSLVNGTIAGAGLDVYEDEPSVPEVLLSMEKVVLLPHLGSASVETRIAIGMRVVKNLTAFFCGEEPPDQII